MDARRRAWPRHALSLIALALVATGCRFGGVPAPEPLGAELGRDPAIRESHDARLPYRLALAPIRAAENTAAASAVDPSRHRDAPALEPARRELATALDESGLFARVAARGEPASTPAQVLDAAWAEQDDLILSVEMRRYEQEYLGHSNYVGWFVTYVTFVWPAWYVPVDFYGVGLEAHVTLRSTLAGTPPLIDAVYRIDAHDDAQELTPDDRELVGFLDVGALWSVESSLSEANWRAIDRQVSPHAWQRFQLALLRDLHAKLARPLAHGTPEEREDTLRKVRKRFAVVAGVTKHEDPAIGQAAFAASDASAFAELLASEKGGSLVSGKSLQLVLDEAATREGILGAIAAVASRAAPSDEVVLYYAGFGAATTANVGTGTGALLAYDAKAQDLAGTGLSLDALGRALDAVKAERVVLLLDTSFGGAPAGTRTFAARSGAAVDLGAALGAGRGRVLLAAARPDQGAHDLVDYRTSLFGAVVRAGLEGGADQDGDGRVTVSELARHARALVASRAGLEGFEQESVLLGGGWELAWPR